MAVYLTSWEQVKAILNLDDDEEAKTLFLIASASAQAERIAGRMLAPRDIDMRFEGRGGKRLLLPSYPVNSVTRFAIDRSRAFPPESDIPPEKYALDAASGTITLYDDCFPRAPGCILFQGNIGYDPVPEDLQQAVIETVSANRRRLSSAGGQVGVKSYTSGEALVANYEIDIPLSARNVFESYWSVRV